MFAIVDVIWERKLEELFLVASVSLCKILEYKNAWHLYQQNLRRIHDNYHANISINDDHKFIFVEDKVNWILQDFLSLSNSVTVVIR